MAKLKLVVENLDDVPEAFRTMYTAREDGKFALNDEFEIEDVAGLRSALAKERKAAGELAKKIKGWEKLGLSEEDIAAKIAALEDHETKEAERKGEWDRLRAQMNDKHEKALKAKDDLLKAKDDEIVKMKGTLESHLIDANATAAIAAAKGFPKLLLPHVRSYTKVVEEDGKFAVRVVDDKGEPRVNGKGAPLSVEELVAEMSQSDIFGRAFEGTGSSGGGTRPAGGGGGNGKFAAFQKKSDFKSEKERATYIDEVGLDAYKALPA